MENNNIGKIFRKIRLGRQMSLKEVSGQSLSLSFISKFERGETEISLSRFLLLLDQLNVNIDEFVKIHQVENPSEVDILMRETANAFFNNNVQMLKKIEENELMKWEKTAKKQYYYNSIMVAAFASEVSGEKLSKSKTQDLSDYLFGVEYWGKYELMIYGNSIGVLPIKTTVLLTNELINRTILFGTVEENYRARIGLLINSIHACLLHNDLINAERFLGVIREMKLGDLLLYEKCEYKFAYGIYLIKCGDISIGKQNAQDALQVLRVLNSTNLLMAREEILKNALSSHI
ncbi:helix-turn-helix domain-containing protein [Gorillibacterium timonense]|uniref:helix-turn-helix domain-containing protein n=1 Tax=Gorillibacterium timonense TaxID=1689269 RepID=UPI00071D51C7|nr:Rgg/GadR/MutR family transcriptional regulator [Gorillibacterium timonense]